MALLALCIAATLAAAEVPGQNNRRRAQAKPLATPPPVLTGAEIISEAGNLDEPESEPVAVPIRTPDPGPRQPDRITNDRTRRSAAKPTYDDKQKRMLLNLDILTRAEQRSESLRKQNFDLIEKENSIRSRLEQIEYDSRPEVIERPLQISGSLRPEELRENRRKTLLAEKRNLEALLIEIQTTRASVSDSLQRADSMVEKLRGKLEKDINDSFLLDDEPQDDQ